MKKMVLWLFAVVVAWALSSCAREVPPDLQQGMAVMRYMTSGKFLSRSMFYAAYPQGKPSDFVSYLFSTIASAEWPPLAGRGEDNAMLREQMAATRTPMVPATVLFVPEKPDLAHAQNQVVIKPDDAANVVILEAYVLPSEDPVLVEKRTLPRFSPDPMAQASYQSAIQMGASPRGR